MPQLDLLIFKYENLNFIISFFLFFFLNQYVIFPAIVRNIVLRRKLINRNLSNDNDIYFSIVFFKKFSLVKLDGFFFSVSVNFLRETINGFYKTVSSISNFFLTFKKAFYIEGIKDFILKAKLLCWLGLFYSNEINYI